MEGVENKSEWFFLVLKKKKNIEMVLSFPVLKRKV